MDITRTVEPRSDQLNYDDVAAETMLITVVEVKKGSPDQPVELHNQEHPGRPYKPGMSMRRVLIAAWGKDAAAYVGRRIELYGDPTIRFGKEAVGGIRIRALSHITSAIELPLTVSRGKRERYVVQPLVEKTEPLAAILQAADTVDNLRKAWELVVQKGKGNEPDLIRIKETRKQELTA